MTDEQSQYDRLGVDAGKKNVRESFGKYIDNDYPGAFVNIVNDPERPDTVFTQHMDGDGSKFVQRLLVYKETRDAAVLGGAVDDALQMNLGDIAASGFVFGRIVVTDVININKTNAPKEEIMERIGRRFAELLELYRRYGFNIYFLGGETADLPDQVKSLVFDVGVYAEAKKKHVVAGKVQPGDRIYGFASDGRAVWEEEDNSGLMSNGLTLARIGLMWTGYTIKYPELIRINGVYEGRFKVNDTVLPLFPRPVHELILSPTRQWAILIRQLLSKLESRGLYHLLHGISMNTGGGATKIGHVGKGIIYRKRMPSPPALFCLIHEETREKWRDMYRGFNCGIGLDIVGADDDRLADVLAEVSKITGVKLHRLGWCEENSSGGNKVVLETDYGTFDDY